MLDETGMFPKGIFPVSEKKVFTSGNPISEGVVDHYAELSGHRNISGRRARLRSDDRSMVNSFVHEEL